MYARRVYLVGLRSRGDMGKTMRLPHNQLVKQYIVEHGGATIQTMLDRVHNIVTVDYGGAVAQATPTTATKFLAGRAPPTLRTPPPAPYRLAPTDSFLRGSLP